ncbi:MAG: hypothetical protein COY69_00565 [Candidatus Magasanikbacteria bacterium CG_4_10_14_0_8_um_filter_32_14]|uniref:Uncharacterized protein n=2 Tax=Candidatus Magasanikiibacteriota TaxID=1752731 RepID=A0A2M7RA56_9BACT|nr:MAG: hypothetical protein AUJ23_01420 [Candidatus Magasanikbacteria bacterium CG1_02_32_51]PIY93643.1 MAG: hypothetical protein COY69_00565 [Candidatus Magasanikbacteria bacterium CG_4_10_14_0_8_um_filter_32_14]
MEFSKLLEELKKLNLSIDKFAIFGSGPLAVRKIREASDIDIVVLSDLYNKFAKDYQINDYNGNITIGNIEICKSCEPLTETIEKLIETADVIDGFPFVSLEYILQFKKILNREKDKRDVKLIEDYLSKTC